jgi:hypothetical protein
MTDTTGALNRVTFFDGRALYPGGYLRIVRGDFISVGVVTASLLIATVALTPAWMVNGSISPDPGNHASVPKGPRTLALANDDRISVNATDVSKPPRISSGPTNASNLTFEARWARATASVPASPLPLVPLLPLEHTNYVPSPPPHPSPPLPFEKRITPQQTHNKSIALLRPDSRTAVYDIAARTVYLPNGERLEAHSGLGNKLDDPRYVNLRMRGPTPPNVYELALREQPFHGVRAIRLKPVDDGKMFGRNGMLAHTYMLGANGQSNGCVSFKDYQKFLQAFLKGEVERLVVVPNLGTEPSLTARARPGQFRRYAYNN